MRRKVLPTTLPKRKRPRNKRPIKQKQIKQKQNVVKKKQTEKQYNPNKWITITFLKEPVRTFFPSNIFPEAVNSIRMDYGEAKRKPKHFWKDKKIIFHMADRTRNEWIPYYKRVINLSKIAWIKFAAKDFMTDMTELDLRRYNTPMSFYRMIDESCDNILWELPLNYNGFWRNKNKVPLTLYDKSYEQPIKNKSIDFLAVLDKRQTQNYVKTLELIKKLGEKHEVKAILIKDPRGLFKKYNKRSIGIETIPNNKSSEGQSLFYNFLQKSKIMIDLSYRWTLGRVVYESLFNGCLSICTNTYGASHHLFPDLMVDAFNFNMQETYKRCVSTLNNWSKNLVENYRKKAQETASPQVFAYNLNNESNRILGI